MGLFLDSDETDVSDSEKVGSSTFADEVRAMIDEWAKSEDSDEEHTREVWMRRLLSHLGVEEK